MSRYVEKIEKLTLPVIPMRGLVAFPGIPLNFEFERDFSIAALEEAQAGDMCVFLAAQRDIAVEKPTSKDIYQTGVIVRIRQSLKAPEGVYRVVAEGLSRATALEYYMQGGCFRANVLSKTISLGNTENDVRCEALMKETVEVLEGILSFLPNVSNDLSARVRSIKNPGLLADFIASSVLARLEDKQAVLEEYNPLRRLETLMVLLESESKLLQTEADIHRRVREQIDQNQRDYYLREQLKIIQGELGMDSEDEVNEYYDKIDKANLPEEVREKLLKETARLAKSPFGSPEATVQRNYLDACLEIPWSKTTKDRIDIAAARRVLDADHDGLEKVKKRIIEFLAVRQLNPDCKGQILCLVGPPGVGKTSLGRSVARAMKRKYVRVSLGGIRDEAEIRGHRKTYVAAMPGRIITALSQCGSRNPVMLLDEIDKLCSDLHGDPSSALLEVLDPEQNKYFRDHFIELPVDLSDCLFIATANTLDTVPRPLIDRMEVIELNTYTPNEKLAIAKHHLLPKQLKRHGLTARSLKLPDETIRALIDGFTRESGVRNLEREIGSLCRKAACRIIDDGVKSVTVRPEELENYLGPKKILPDKIAPEDEIGVVNGLAFTESGGDLLKVEATVMEGTGKIELTGSLGDVMKESAHIAVSYIRAHAAELGVPADFYKTKDVHVHFPEGAVPKDGPSAGVTMVTALVSALTGKPVRRDLAMTGEVTLTGRVLPIGGLREKTTAAWGAGVSAVCIPAENMRDLEEIDQGVRQSLLFIPCRHVSDVLREALTLEGVSEIVRKPSEEIPASIVYTPGQPQRRAEI